VEAGGGNPGHRHEEHGVEAESKTLWTDLSLVVLRAASHLCRFKSGIQPNTEGLRRVTTTGERTAWLRA